MQLLARKRAHLRHAFSLRMHAYARMYERTKPRRGRHFTREARGEETSSAQYMRDMRVRLLFAFSNHPSCARPALRPLLPPVSFILVPSRSPVENEN